VKSIDTLSQAQNISLLAQSGAQVDPEQENISGNEPERPSSAVQALMEEEAAQETPSRAKTRSKDKRKPSQRMRDQAEVNNVNEVDPTSYTGAMKTPHAKQWQVAVDDKLNALRQNGT
jgi:hypothetical protein